MYHSKLFLINLISFFLVFAAANASEKCDPKYAGKWQCTADVEKGSLEINLKTINGIDHIGMFDSKSGTPVYFPANDSWIEYPEILPHMFFKLSCKNGEVAILSEVKKAGTTTQAGSVVLKLLDSSKTKMQMQNKYISSDIDAKTLTETANCIRL